MQLMTVHVWPNSTLLSDQQTFPSPAVLPSWLSGATLQSHVDRQRQAEVRAETTTLRYRKRRDWRKSVVDLNMRQWGGNGTWIEAESMLSPLWTTRAASGLRDVIATGFVAATGTNRPNRKWGPLLNGWYEMFPRDKSFGTWSWLLSFT